MEYSLVFYVVNMGNADKIFKHIKNFEIEGGVVSIGKGTVNSRLLDFLGLNEIRKEIVTIIVKRELASEMIKDVSEFMEFAKPNHGIAFSCPISEYYGGAYEPAFSESESDIAVQNIVRRESMYSIIYTIVEKGKAEDVVEAASKAGAGGGTILNARGAGSEVVRKFFSIEIEPEKEEVFIIAKNDIKDNIVKSIREALEIEKPGNGVLFVLAADEVCGLH